MTDTTTLSLADQYKGNVAAIIGAYYASKAAKIAPTPEKDPFDKEPPKRVFSYQQSSSDVGNDSLQTARAVGDLTKGKTRLNVISALTKNDKVDFFKFNATVDEKLGIALKADKGVRIQILSSTGKVIADSEAKSGEKKDNYEKATTQDLQIKKGVYFLKVTRETGALSDIRPNYAIQISTTKYYERDYDTTETPARNTIYAAVSAQNSGGINSLLTQFNGQFLDNLKSSNYSKRV